MSILEFVAVRLKELRRKNDLTQEQVAMLLGTDLRWYQRIEAGDKDIRASTIDRLAAAFGLSVVDFLGKSVPEGRVKKVPQKAPHRPKKTPAMKRAATKKAG